jgi:undecaprenol kinase
MKRWGRGVGFAFEGIISAIKTEPNLRFHIVAAVVILTLAAFFGFQRWEWIVLLLTISLVVVLELVNTAVEKTVDLVTDSIHPLAKLAKDISAGAVLISVIFAIVVGILLFYPYIYDWISTI